MIGFLISALKIIFLLGFLIFIHEGGHFLVAKLCKVRVNEFAIGFGPTIWRKKGKETTYAVRLIPLGGFVSMEGEEERSSNEGSFSQASIPKRMAIVVAGAAVNIVFALVVYFILMASTGNYVTTRIEQVLEGNAAQTAGIMVGDKIVAINDKTIHLKEDIDSAVANSNGQEMKVTVEREGEKKEIYVTPSTKTRKVTGIYLQATGNKLTQIAQIDQNSAAQKAGLAIGDEILAINGQQINGDQTILLQLMQEQGNTTMEMTVQRGNETLNFQLTPSDEFYYELGIIVKQAGDNFSERIYYGYWETISFMGSILDNLKELFTGNIGLDQMMGPVGISSVVSSTQGIQDFVYILALISLSLGVTNLLPIPALDGGKLLILLIEAIRRKPLQEKTEISIQMLGFAFLIVLSIVVAYQDIVRIF